MVVRVLLFVLVLWGVWKYGRPWELGWLRSDEAQEIAEEFLLRQNVDLGKYTLIRAVERRDDGVWSPRQSEWQFAMNPAVGYVFRYFKPKEEDGWTVGVSPIGRIYRVKRQMLEDDPGLRLDRYDAYEVIGNKLAFDLHLPYNEFHMRDDSLVAQPQRSDWYYRFAWPEVLDSGTVAVTLSGNALTELQFSGEDTLSRIAPAEPVESRRVLSFLLILIGTFLIMHYHRTPLAVRSAGIWGAVVFVLTLAVRGLTFSQAVILMPHDVPLTGYLSRVALAAVIEALQSAILLGLIVAAGESLSRDVLRRATSLSRMSTGISSWSAAWAQAVRWAFPAAIIVLIYEAIASQHLGPVGLVGKVPLLVANTLSSPIPEIALPAQVGLSFVWEESTFRLWLLALLLFWLRSSTLSVPIAALTATYFAGYDLSQFLQAGALFYTAWGLIAGFLMLRVGIVAAMLFHALVLGGYAGVAMLWTGFGMGTGLIMLALTLGLILLIARTPRAAPENG